MIKIWLLTALCFSQIALSANSLSLVSPLLTSTKLSSPVQTRTALNGHFLNIHFDVEARKINAKPQLKENEYPFQFDVVEVFLSVGDTAYPYYELEVSPYNQSFVVRIDGPKKFVNHAKIEWTHTAQKTAHGWSANMTIDLSKLGWNGDVSKIRGNLYAITGKSPNRHFWSLSLPPMKKANFHSPQYFKSLL